jgi:hypothetical protein
MPAIDGDVPSWTERFEQVIIKNALAAKYVEISKCHSGVPGLESWIQRTQAPTRGLQVQTITSIDCRMETFLDYQEICASNLVEAVEWRSCNTLVS